MFEECNRLQNFEELMTQLNNLEKNQINELNIQKKKLM